MPQKYKTNRNYTRYSYEAKPVLTTDDVGDKLYIIDEKCKYEWIGEDWALLYKEGALPLNTTTLYTESRSVDTLQEILDQLKILNTYLANANGEAISIEEIEDR